MLPLEPEVIAPLDPREEPLLVEVPRLVLWPVLTLEDLEALSLLPVLVDWL